jgi:hypothetical protein
VEDLEKTARYTAEKIELTKQSKILQRLAKSMIHDIASAFKTITGSYPPYSKDTWFPVFVALVGKELGLKCGRALVESVIRDIQHPT